MSEDELYNAAKSLENNNYLTKEMLSIEKECFIDGLYYLNSSKVRQCK